MKVASCEVALPHFLGPEQIPSSEKSVTYNFLVLTSLSHGNAPSPPRYKSKSSSVILATIHARGKCSFHLADKTSTSTTSPANSMLAISENVACSGYA